MNGLHTADCNSPVMLHDLALHEQPADRHDAPRILWIHGYTMSSELWRPLWAWLPEFHHTGLDLPGHGDTRRPIRPKAPLSDMAVAVQEASQASGARIVAGLSFGATVAFQAALERPAEFDTVLLASLNLCGGEQDAEAATCHLEMKRLLVARGIGPWLAQRWLSVPPRIFAGAQRRPDLFAAIRRVVEAHTWLELSNQGMVAMARYKQDPALAKGLEGKLALLVGEQDLPSCVRSAYQLKRQVKGTTCEHLEDCGHLPLLERPEAAAQWVRSSLATRLGRIGAGGAP